MEILKKVFIDENLNLFTNREDLHRFNKIRLFKTDTPDSVWIINHDLKGMEIHSQTLTRGEAGSFEVIYPDSITHFTNKTEIRFSEPQDGVALLVNVDVAATLDWQQIPTSI